MRLRLYVPIDIAFKLDFVLCKSNRLVAQFLGSVSLFIMLRFLFGVVFLPCLLTDEALVSAICGNASPARDLVTISANGNDGINRASVLRNDNISVVLTSEYIQTAVVITPILLPYQRTTEGTKTLALYW